MLGFCPGTLSTLSLLLAGLGGIRTLALGFLPMHWFAVTTQRDL